MIVIHLYFYLFTKIFFKLHVEVLREGQVRRPSLFYILKYFFGLVAPDINLNYGDLLCLLEISQTQC